LKLKKVGGTEEGELKRVKKIYMLQLCLQLLFV